MYFTIYKTTNLVNGKYYIGKHCTNDLNDDYMGSGIAIKYAIKKYGKDNFKKEIVLLCEDETQLNLAERILVVPDISNYNLMRGGEGVLGGKLHPRYGVQWTKEVKQKISKKLKGKLQGPNNKKSHPGNKNPMYGKKREEVRIYNMLFHPNLFKNKKCWI